MADQPGGDGGGRARVWESFLTALNEIRNTLLVKANTVDNHHALLEEHEKRLDRVHETLHGVGSQEPSGLATRVMLLERDKATAEKKAEADQKARDSWMMALGGAVLAVIGKLLYDVLSK